MIKLTFTFTCTVTEDEIKGVLTNDGEEWEQWIGSNGCEKNSMKISGLELVARLTNAVDTCMSGRDDHPVLTFTQR